LRFSKEIRYHYRRQQQENSEQGSETDTVRSSFFFRKSLCIGISAILEHGMKNESIPINPSISTCELKIHRVQSKINRKSEIRSFLDVLSRQTAPPGLNPAHAQ